MYIKKLFTYNYDFSHKIQTELILITELFDHFPLILHTDLQMN